MGKFGDNACDVSPLPGLARRTGVFRLAITHKFGATKWFILNEEARNEPEVKDPAPLAKPVLVQRFVASVCLTHSKPEF